MNNLQLTQSQFSIWMGQKLNPESPLYNMAHVFNIYTSINIEAFKEAFNQLIEHSDALRTVFYDENGEPYQKVHSSFSYDLEFLDFSNKKKSELQDFLKSRSKNRFNLGECVFDSILIQVNDNHFVWFLNIHHIVTDATSSTILFNLMSDLYKNNETITSVPQFQSYVNYELEQRSAENKKIVREYWKEKINGLKVPELYGRKNNNQNTKANRILIPLGKVRSEKLKEIAKLPEIRSWTQDLTLFNIFSSILFVYIYRVSGQNKLAIGAPSHNRPSKIFKETPGLFIEFFPLVEKVEANDTFFEVLQRVKIETNNYLRHAQPGMSTPELNKSYNVVLNFINAKFSDFNGSKMESEWIHPEHVDASHDLRCHVYDMDASGKFSIILDLNEAVFNDKYKNQAASHFLKVIDAFIDDINQPIQKQSL